MRPIRRAANAALDGTVDGTVDGWAIPAQPGDLATGLARHYARNA